jgi:O-antigen/teichoic acid export membrane protein
MASEDSRRIIRNTGMLYIRMLLTMAITLYTARIVLNVLGIEDYGIYNVVGGFVAMIGFLNNSMAAATQRFLSFEMGRKDLYQQSRVFSMSVNIHFIIALIILLIAETVGLWFINTQLTIPEDRMIAANWVYQFSILAFLVSVVSVPYNAAIIANERMDAFAVVSIVDVSLKLIIVFVLQWFGYDKLIFYAILVFIISLIIRLIYGIYCTRNFSESKYMVFWDRNLFKTLINFAGWNLWGNSAAVLHGQGVNILLNIFFGPAVNAARGIAYQVMGAVNGFVQNFQIAMNPQIIKSYASSDLKYMHQLIYHGAKYSFFLLFAISLPILMETEILLQLWLKIVPEYTVVFSQLVIINVLIDSVSGPLMTAAQASGKIKRYQTMVGGLLLLILPLSYIFLKLGFSPEVTFYISIIISLITLFARLRIISPLVSITIAGFTHYVILRILSVVIIAIIFPIFFRQIIPSGVFRLLTVTFTSVLSVGIAIYSIGLTRSEQIFMQVKIKNLIAYASFWN